MTPNNLTTIRYAGSKSKILYKINDILRSVDYDKVLDAFSGSGKVSSYFKYMGKKVHANDLAVYSKVINETHLLGSNNRNKIEKQIDYLNKLEPKRGWYTENYGGEYNNGMSLQNDGYKKPFYINVSMKLDAIRDEIDVLYPEECIDKSILITSLMKALDLRCNDLGHHVSYLKKWTKGSLKPLVLEYPAFNAYCSDHVVTNFDVFNLNGEYDLAYFDPPYGTANTKTPTSRVRYFSYYHLWTTIVLNDKPSLFGAAKRREDVSSDTKPGAISPFESTDENVVIDAFNNLFNSINSKYYLVSYSNRSKLSMPKLIDICKQHGDIITIESFKHAPNSQSNTVSHGDYKINYEEDNLEFLVLLKTKQK